VRLREGANKEMTKAEWMFGEPTDPREITIGGEDFSQFEVDGIPVIRTK